MFLRLPTSSMTMVWELVALNSSRSWFPGPGQEGNRGSPWKKRKYGHSSLPCTPRGRGRVRRSSAAYREAARCRHRSDTVKRNRDTPKSDSFRRETIQTQSHRRSVSGSEGSVKLIEFVIGQIGLEFASFLVQRCAVVLHFRIHLHAAFRMKPSPGPHIENQKYLSDLQVGFTVEIGGQNRTRPILVGSMKDNHVGRNELIFANFDDISDLGMHTSLECQTRDVGRSGNTFLL